MSQKVVLPFPRYIKEETQEVLSDLNVWGLGKKLGRRIDPNDPADRQLLFQHWEDTGAHERFNETYVQEAAVT